MARSASKSIKSEKGSMLIISLVATSLFLIITTGAIGLAIMQQKLNIRKVARSQALHIAEAGVNYYRWVLYHDSDDYCNSEACQGAPDYGPYGPYSYTDSAGQGIIGYYELYITPPPLNGSTIVNIRAVGWVADYPNIKREVEVQCGIPSWSTYSTLANDEMRFGSGTEVWGPIHSNDGIRFDGLAHHLITSALCRYDDPDHSGGEEFAVHTHVFPTDPAPDANCPPGNKPDRTDVFESGRSFPEPIVSFDLLNNYVNGAYELATTSGIVFDPRPAGTADPYSISDYWGCGSAGSTCDEGFRITLRTDDKFDIRGVYSVDPDCAGNPSNSMDGQEAVVRTYDIPANGMIFVKNNIWVDGQIDNSRVTIIAFEEPFAGGSADIYLTNDLMYTNYDGTDAIGLIAQNDISVGLDSEDFLTVDAALIAKGGRIGREWYSTCTNSIRNTITVTGSLATNQRYGFAWTDGTGYQIRNLVYDNNLTFIPPPHFPTTGEYTFISWREK